MKYAWVTDALDFRDYSFSQKPTTVQNLPLKVDLRNTHKIVHNQGAVGSCVHNSSVLALDFTRVKEGLDPIFGSRLFGYYNTREIESTVNEDSGCQIRNAMKSLATTGICVEKLWDYNIKPHHFYMKPTDACYNEAKNHKLLGYFRLNNTNLDTLKSCLAEGYTFVFGMAVYESFESYYTSQTGIVSYPSINETFLGGHCMLCIGYNAANQCFIVRNSWGIGWGDKGHCYIPFQYLTNNSLADDFWTMRIC